MTPEPTAMPPPNGHSHTSATRITQPIRDRWGHPYTLVGNFLSDAIRFTVQTDRGAEIGKLELVIDGREGQLVRLSVTDGASPWMPKWAQKQLVRFAPGWTATGHRERGLGSLLLIFSLKAACDRELRQVEARRIPATAQSLFRHLGFTLHESDRGIVATFRISD